ncbi:FtsK/SpoIIIE domain-containing protein [Arthrobacter pigmenti]
MQQEATKTSIPETIEISYGATVKDVNPAWQRRIETIISLKVGGRWRSRFYPQKDKCILEQRPDLPDLINHPGVEIYKTLNNPKPVLFYARDENGKDVGWELGGPNPHTLVIGPTGGGKTTVFRSLIVGAVAQGIPVYGCDPKRVELRPFEGYPGVGGIASSDVKMSALIEDMHTLMEARYAQIEKNPASKDTMSPVMFILDELLILRSKLTTLWKETPDENGKKRTGQPRWFGMIQNLLALARTAKIHVVIGVQRPDASLFEDGARDNLQHRVSLMRLSAEGSKMLWGNATTGIDLPVKQGRAMASPDGRTPIEVQTYWLSEPGAATGHDKDTLDELAGHATTLFHAYEWPIDPSRYELIGAPQDKEAQEASYDNGESSQDDVTLASGGELEETSIDGESIDTENVRAESLTDGDKVLLDSGLVAVVTDIEDEDELVNITIDAYGETEMLSVEAGEYLPRVLTYDDTTD